MSFRSLRRGFLPSAGLLIALPAASSAQFGDAWVSFTSGQAKLGLSPTAVSNGNIETDFAWADLNADGATDLVVVRKQPFTSPGKRTNLLLMNESGSLQDRTAQYATASDVAGDQGFNTPTNDRDVILVDVDNDGDLEIVTCTTISDGDPKHIGHPRIYNNLGGAGASWLGFGYEDARFPQLFHFGNGQPRNPRFCSVAGGDVSNDGFADLYFGDYDASGAGGAGQPPDFDLNDRLLINDGTGHFSDESQARMTSQMLLSAFGNSVVIHDFNQDGFNDIVKDTALVAPQYVAASYNDPNNPGFFSLFHNFHSNAPYHTSEGDLNNDGRTDLVISDDAQDRVRINNGVDALGRVVWSPALTFDYLSGGDDGFASNNLIVDIDGDGWNDVLVADVDVDISGCNRRLHIYHNETTVVGAASNGDLVLVEERQQASDAGWIGAKGLKISDLRGTHDVAVFDIEQDGDKDLVISRCTGTYVWLNESVPQVCQPSLGFVGPGTSRLEVCGDALATGGLADLLVFNAPANAQAYLTMAYTQHAVPLFGGKLITFPPFLIFPMTTDDFGQAAINGIPGGGGPVSIFAQVVLVDASQVEGFQITNALELEYLP